MSFWTKIKDAFRKMVRKTRNPQKEQDWLEAYNTQVPPVDPNELIDLNQPSRKG